MRGREKNIFLGNKFLGALLMLGGISLLGFGKKKSKSFHTAGQTRETIAFTTKLVAEGKMTPEEKLRMDNLSIYTNSIVNLLGFETYAEEKPDEWEEFLKSKKLKK